MSQQSLNSLTRRKFWPTTAGMLSLAVSCGRGQTMVESHLKELSPSESRLITHTLGTTRVPKVPQRLVALTGTLELEALLVLGVKPFAAAGDDREFGRTVWQPHLKEQLHGVEMLPSRRNVNLEKLAALQPDLIIGALVFDIESIYPQLSQIAPTVTLDSSQPWQSHLRLVAQVVDKAEQAETWISTFEQRVAALANTYGEKVTGITYTTGSFRNQRQFHMSTGHELDQMLQQIGFIRPSEHNQIGKVQRGSFRRADISLERLDLIDTDLLFFYSYEYPTIQKAHELPEFDQFLKEEPLLRRLRAIENGRAFLVPAYYWFLGRAMGIPLIVDDLEATILPFIIQQSHSQAVRLPDRLYKNKLQ
ncbi:MAG: iron-siderophore ABC transporter substrate-binding protein [Cyanobacteria bacterium P01_H01_bin.21]